MGIGVAIAVGLAELARGASNNVDLATPVFGASATFAALFLPAAGLVNQYTTTRLPSLAADLIENAASRDDIDAVHVIVGRVLVAVRALPSSFVLFVVALASATLGLFRPRFVLLHWQARWLQVPPQAVLVGFAAAADFMAAAKLLPLARVLLDRKILESLYKATAPPDHVPDSAVAAAKEHPVSAPSTDIPPPSG